MTCDHWRDVSTPQGIQSAEMIETSIDGMKHIADVILIAFCAGSFWGLNAVALPIVLRLPERLCRIRVCFN